MMIPILTYLIFIVFIVMILYSIDFCSSITIVCFLSVQRSIMNVFHLHGHLIKVFCYEEIVNVLL